MARHLTVISILAMWLVFIVPAHAQDSQSLGDVARQAKKDKADKPVAKVFTNDDMSSVSAGASAPPSATVQASSGKAQSANKENADTVQSSAEGMERLQSALEHLESLDKRSLAVEVLEGNESNFPGRAAWEEKLFAAKQLFVAQTRASLQKAKEIALSGQAFKDAQDMNDPRVKSIAAKLDRLVQETQGNRAAFQVVIVEGRELAGLPDAQ